mgnify:CR=1 FL=1
MAYKVIDKFHRYYLSRYPVNPYSYAVHRLTPEKIKEIIQEEKTKVKKNSFKNENISH